MVHMDEVAAHYDETIPVHVRNHYLRKRVAAIRTRLAQGLVLDVGCGTGALAAALQEAGMTVMGMDQSLGMLRQCRERRRISCFCGDAGTLPIASEGVDGVICIASLHHLVSPDLVRQTIREMLRVVKPGGWAVVWDHNPLNPYWPMFMRRLPQDQEPTRLVSLREVVDALEGMRGIRIHAQRSGLVPDFAPRRLLWLFQALEWIVERLPGLRLLCAHNVVLVQKLSVDHVAA